MSKLKVEGKVSDWCPNCKNCKGITRMHDGKNASIRITEVKCKDPYDGRVKTLDADSDICCSMFEPTPPCEKCERFDGTYCHNPNGIFVTSYMALFSDYDTGNCPLYEEKKETCETKTAREIELEARVTALLGEVGNLQKDNEKLENENTSLNTINKGLAEDRKKLINYMRSLKIASENYLKEFTYEED